MLMYLSFADDERCRGVCLVEVPHADIVFAARLAHRLGINPGGQVLGCPVPEELEAELAPLANRLFTSEEARAIFGGKSVAELDAEDGS